MLKLIGDSSMTSPFLLRRFWLNSTLMFVPLGVSLRLSLKPAPLGVSRNARLRAFPSLPAGDSVDMAARCVVLQNCTPARPFFGCV